MRKVPYIPREPSKVKKYLLDLSFEIAEGDENCNLQDHCDMIVAYSEDKSAWGYDPHLTLKVYSGEVRTLRTHWGDFGVEHGETLLKTFVDQKQCGEFYSEETVEEIVSDYVEQVMEVLGSVTAYTERDFKGVVHGDQLIVKNGKIYVSEDCSFAVEGSDSYGVLETDERWVKLEGLGYVGWDKVISLI